MFRDGLNSQHWHVYILQMDSLHIDEEICKSTFIPIASTEKNSKNSTHTRKNASKNVSDAIAENKVIDAQNTAHLHRWQMHLLHVVRERVFDLLKIHFKRHFAAIKNNFDRRLALNMQNIQ